MSEIERLFELQRAGRAVIAALLAIDHEVERADVRAELARNLANTPEARHRFRGIMEALLGVLWQMNALAARSEREEPPE